VTDLSRKEGGTEERLGGGKGGESKRNGKWRKNLSEGRGDAGRSDLFIKNIVPGGLTRSGRSWGGPVRGGERGGRSETGSETHIISSKPSKSNIGFRD